MAGDCSAFIVHYPKNKQRDERILQKRVKTAVFNLLLWLLSLICRRDGQTRITVAVVQPKCVAALQVS